MKLNMRLFQRKNGYWYYELERDKPRSLKTKNAKEAKQVYNAIKKAILQQRLIELDSGKRITLNNFKDIFFQKHTDIADKTHEAYDLAIRLLIDTVGGSTLLSRIDDELLGRFKTNCLARGVNKISVNTYLRHIRGFLNKAYDWGDLKQKIKIEFFKIGKRLPRIFSKSEVSKILKHAKKHSFEMYRIILFALYTGARRKEIWLLKWQDVGVGICNIIGKGDKERTVALASKAFEAMGLKKDIGYIFWHPNELDKYTKEFKVILRACGIDDHRSFHNLRHTAATQMLASGFRLEEVQEMLGHEDIKTTQIYAKVLQEQLKKKVKKLAY